MAMAVGQDPSWPWASSTPLGDIHARAGAALGLHKHAGPATLKSGTEEALQSGINTLLL